MMDRVYVDDETLFFYNSSRLIGDNDFNLNVGHKEKFILAMAFGFKLGHRTPLKKEKELTLLKYFNSKDMSLLYAVAYASTTDENILNNEDEIIRICQEYANTGIHFINNLEMMSSSENFLLEFEKVINDQIRYIKRDDNE